MTLPREGKLLRIFVGESDRYEGELVYEWNVMRARDVGLAGATVLRGLEGFGAHSKQHHLGRPRTPRLMPPRRSVLTKLKSYHLRAASNG